MSVESFIDTNVFVYQLERLDIRKATMADRLIGQGIASSGTARLELGSGTLIMASTAQDISTLRPEDAVTIRTGASVPRRRERCISTPVAAPLRISSKPIATRYH